MPGADIISGEKSNGIITISTIADIDIMDKTKGLSGILAFAKAWGLSKNGAVDFCGSLDGDKGACSVARKWATAFRNENADLQNNIISTLSETASNVPYAICKYALFKFKCLTFTL